MRIVPTLLIIFMLILTSCLDLEEEPLLSISPSAVISAHIKNQKIYSTALVEVNPHVIYGGNIPSYYEFSGELAIYDTSNGNVIDVNTFIGGGLSQTHTVSADTIGRDRFIVIAKGTIKAYADISNDGDASDDKLISGGDFYQEAQFKVSDLLKK